MADGMSFDKYIDNPSGGQVFTNRQMYKDMYKKKFDALMVREQSRIAYKIYKANDTVDAYYIHFKIPSEVIENFYYDVVIRLFTTDNLKKTQPNLRSYAVNFYSNDPAFVYTFAHSFKKNKLFIPDLESKMSKRALRENADIRNPKNNVWYVKSLFFAYLAMEKYNLFARPMLNQNSVSYNKKELLRNITDADIKVAARQREGDLLKEKERQAKNDKERELHNKYRSSHPQKFQTKRSTISKVSTVSRVSKTSKTSKVSKKTKST